ncbi:hypothetical protein [Streptomyces nojiriensis]|nr:hypothetical protein [Streptomyces nojiriensis]
MEMDSGISVTPVIAATRPLGHAAAGDAPPGSDRIVMEAACQGRIAYGPAIAVRIPPRVTHPKDE